MVYLELCVFRSLALRWHLLLLPFTGRSTVDSVTDLELMKLSSGPNSTLYLYYILFILLVISEKLVAWLPPSAALLEPNSVVSSSYMLLKRKSMPPASLTFSG